MSQNPRNKTINVFRGSEEELITMFRSEAYGKSKSTGKVTRIAFIYYTTDSPITFIWVRTHHLAQEYVTVLHLKYWQRYDAYGDYVTVKKERGIKEAAAIRAYKDD